MTQYIVSNPVRSIETGIRLGFSLWNRRLGDGSASASTSQKPDVVHIHNTWFSITPAANR